MYLHGLAHLRLPHSFWVSLREEHEAWFILNIGLGLSLCNPCNLSLRTIGYQTLTRKKLCCFRPVLANDNFLHHVLK